MCEQRGSGRPGLALVWSSGTSGGCHRGRDMWLRLQCSRFSLGRGTGSAVAGREWKSGASRPLLTRLLEMKPAGLETPLPRQPLALSHQLSWINHLCLINGTQEPLSRRLLKNYGIAGEAGQRRSWKWGLRGSILAQMRTLNIVLQKDAC